MPQVARAAQARPGVVSMEITSDSQHNEDDPDQQSRLELQRAIIACTESSLKDKILAAMDAPPAAQQDSLGPQRKPINVQIAAASRDAVKLEARIAKTKKKVTEAHQQAVDALGWHASVISSLVARLDKDTAKHAKLTLKISGLQAQVPAQPAEVSLATPRTQEEIKNDIALSLLYASGFVSQPSAGSADSSMAPLDLSSVTSLASAGSVEYPAVGAEEEGGSLSGISSDGENDDQLLAQQLLAQQQQQTQAQLQEVRAQCALAPPAVEQTPYAAARGTSLKPFSRPRTSPYTGDKDGAATIATNALMAAQAASKAAAERATEVVSVDSPTGAESSAAAAPLGTDAVRSADGGATEAAAEDVGIAELEADAVQKRQRRPPGMPHCG